MTFNHRPGVWRTEFPEPHLEINLGGDASHPFPVNVEMSKACEAQLADVLSKALAFIAKHIRESAAVSGEPELEWIDFGLSNYGQHNEFEVYFSDAATYVLWAVRFHYHCDPRTHVTTLKPVGLSRRSW